MKNIFLTILFLTLSSICYGQANEKHLDFVIVVDNDIGMASISTAFMLRFDNDSVRQINLYYHPGELSISEADYEIIMSDKVKKIQLLCNYLRYDGDKRITRDYEIELKPWWLKSLYSVIRIYNVDKGPYKGVFKPLSKDKPYTFELFSPGNTFTRVRYK